MQLSTLVATLDKGRNHEQVTLLLALDILMMLAMPVMCLQRKEVPLVSYLEGITNE